MDLPQATKANYDQLKVELLRQLDCQEAEVLVSLLLTTRQQRPNESIADFFWEIQKLADQGYRTLTPADRELLFFRSFIANLHPYYQGALVPENQRDFADVVKKASQLEALENMRSSCGMSATTAPLSAPVQGSVQTGAPWLTPSLSSSERPDNQRCFSNTVEQLKGEID